MDVLIRNVTPKYVDEIDRKAGELSKDLGRKFSRNEYIKMLIQNDYEVRLWELKKGEFDGVVDNLNTTLDRQTRTLQEFIDSIARLFHLMVGGSDLWEEVNKL